MDPRPRNESREVRTMKYLPATFAVISGCGLIGFSVWLTHNPMCLWGLLLVMWMSCGLMDLSEKQTAPNSGTGREGK